MNNLGVKQNHFSRQLGQKIGHTGQKLGTKFINTMVRNQPIFKKIDNITTTADSGLRFIPGVSNASGITSAVAHMANKAVTAKKNSLERHNERKKAIEAENNREMKSAVMGPGFY